MAEPECETNFLFNRKWISYEWKYDEIERNFFKHVNTFETNLQKHFPKLRTSNLTKAEWRKIRRLLKCKKRFSSKFVIEQRCELQKYRLKFDLCQGECFTHAQTDQRKQMFLLIIEARKLLAEKQIQIQQFMSTINNYHTKNDISDSVIKDNLNQIAFEMTKRNKQILKNFDRLGDFEVVRESLLSGTRYPFTNTLEYFEWKSEIAVDDKMQQYRLDDNENISSLIKTLLIISYALFELSMSREHFVQFAEQNLEKLEDIIDIDQLKSVKGPILLNLCSTFDKIKLKKLNFN